MKKTVLILIAVMSSLFVQAQTDSSRRTTSPSEIIIHADSVKSANDEFNKSQERMENYPDSTRKNNQLNTASRDGVFMKDGKLMMIHDGKVEMMNHTMTMSNGTKVMIDGSMISKAGSKSKITEGQHIDSAGKLTTLKKSDELMYVK
ncbi:MAG: hypothetical protein IPM91_00405 [Bacteroidetes bacterium]|jgi:phage/plasmid primase-like uncharacterized protein|nr:hypothetical protein [Bacteroidota bacterium]